ncbi:hypothetical protein [Streptomyces flaveolus]|uniref:hypothetical protein n=1 Tax=Streptomyces flaveolus TaxID=67297 RepID=UPI00167061B3|nr:hypothetical protein [Streptomyces flaveolus]GGQ85091.1 hypothetical protein GCM10010216_53620 [Streptomyces flaveolus]
MKPLSVQRVRVLADYYGLCLQDADDSWLPAVFPQDFIAGDFGTPRPGRIDLTTAAHTQHVGVTVQAWEDEPPLLEGSWDKTAKARIECRSGTLRLWSMGGPGLEDITLPSAPATWNTRIYCTGRQEAAAASRNGVPDGLEQYVVQFWPVEGVG